MADGPRLRVAQLHRTAAPVPAGALVQGTVLRVFPLIESQDGPILRFGLRDDIKDARMDAANDIEVILKGDLATRCEGHLQRSPLVILEGFLVVDRFAVGAFDADDMESETLGQGCVLCTGKISIRSGADEAPWVILCGGDTESQPEPRQSKRPRIAPPDAGQAADGGPVAGDAAAAVPVSQTSGGAAAKGSAPKAPYLYHTVTEVCSSLENSTKFNAWGVVTHFQNPKTTTGTDLIMTLRITDDSITSEGLQVIIFRPEPEDFPHVRRIGDIIRFHRIKRNTYGPSLRLTELFRSTDKDKGGGGSSTVAPLTPRELQAKPDLAFSWTDEDVARLRHLRSWAQSIPELRTNTGATLSDLCSTSNYVDLVARVSHVAQVSEYKALVFVCDGSVPAPKCPLYRAERPPETAAAASTQIHRLEYDRSVMINVWDELVPKVESLSIGQLVRLRQVEVRVREGAMYLDMKPRSNSWFETRGLDPSSDQMVRDTLDRLRSMAAVATAADAADAVTTNLGGEASAPSVAALPPPSTSARALVAAPSTGVSSTSGLATTPEGGRRRAVFCTRITGNLPPTVTPVAVALTEVPPQKFRFNCRCVEILPSHVPDVCRALCASCQEFYLLKDVPLDPSSVERQCPSCLGSLSYYYIFTVHLQDSSGSIQARVCGNAAEMLLGGGLPPTDLYANNCSLDVVKRKLAKLSAPDVQLDCVVVKYHHVDKPNIELFQVVETQII